MKHRWHLIELRHQDGFRCMQCGQEWPDSEMELFKAMDALPCPNFLGRRGHFHIEFKRWKAQEWTYHTSCENIRQAIEFCRHRFADCELQLWHPATKSWIEDF